MLKGRINKIKAKLLRRKFRKNHKHSYLGLLLYKDYAKLFCKLIDLNQTNVSEIKYIYEIVPQMVKGVIEFIESKESFISVFEKTSNHKVYFLKNAVKTVFYRKDLKIEDIKDLSIGLDDKYLKDLKVDVLVLLRGVSDAINIFLEFDNLDDMGNELLRLEGIFDDLEKKIIGFRDKLITQMSFGNMSRRKFMSAMGTGALYGKTFINMIRNGEILLNVVNTLLEPYCRKYPKKGLAILIGDALGSDKAIGLYDFYALRVQIMMGMRAKIFNDVATKKDFFDVLKDPSIDHVVVLSHGSYNHMKFLDGKVTSQDVSNNYSHKKKGFLVKHGCGGENKSLFYSGYGAPWGYPIFDKHKIIHWRRVINSFDIILNPWNKKDTWDSFLVNLVNENGFKLREIMRKKMS